MWARVNSGRLLLSCIGEFRVHREPGEGLSRPVKWSDLGFGSPLCCSVATGGRDEIEAGHHDEFEGSSKHMAQKRPGEVKGMALALDRSGSQSLLCSPYAVYPLNMSFPLCKMRIKIVLPNKRVVKIK